MSQRVYDWREAPRGDFAVIGDPIEHTLSPRMHEAAFAALGESYSYHAVRVIRGEVADALHHLARLGYRGVNVTVPHKAEAFDATRTGDEFTAMVCAVNTVSLHHFHGINTDGPGFMESLDGLVQPGCKVLLLGAGGSARSIALALARGGYNISVFNRTPERALTLVRELEIEAEVVDYPAAKDVQLIVNATSTTLQNQALTVPFSQAAPDALAYDLAYGVSAFLKDAEDAGLRVLDGKEMLVGQGALAQEYWLGRPAPRDVMREAIS